MSIKIKNYLLISLIFISLISSVLTNAQEANEPAVTTQPEISAQDLGISDPTLLPSSPFYFLKNWGQNIRLFFTFNPIKKAELQLRYVTEKAMESKKVKDNKEALTKALNNYLDARRKLEERFNKIKETSQNPNVSILLDKFVEQNEKHQKLFQELIDKTDKATKDSIKDIITEVKQQTIEVPIKFEAAPKVIERINKAIDKTSEAEFKNFQKILKYEDFSNLTENKDLKEKLEKAKEMAIENLATEIKNQVKAKEQFEEFIIKKVNQKETATAVAPSVIPIIIEELKTKIKIPEVQIVLDEAQNQIFRKTIENKEEIAENAFRTIKSAQLILDEIITEIDKIKDKLSEQDIKHLEKLIKLTNEHLDMAKKEMDNKKYGSAFGHATSAIAIGKEALRYMSQKLESPTEKTAPKVTPIPVPLFEKKIENLEKKLEMEKRTSVPQYIGPPIPATEPPTLICSQQYAPVCGKDNKTYSNKCFAKAAGVEIAYEGECKSDKEELTKPPIYIGPPIPAPQEETKTTP